MSRSCAIVVGLLALWVMGFIVVVPLVGEALYAQSPLQGTGQPFNRDAYGSLGFAIVLYVIGTATLVVIGLRRRRR
ncbi:MAG: hypothetical protein PVH07_07560 [Chloroflexota bacterium]|jgi:hypothetical protein